MEELLAQLGELTGIAEFMGLKWTWPIIESIHFIGLSLLIGTVGIFDLRMLGVARGIPLRALHKLVPFGVAGFIINVVTGTMFLVSAPDQYVYNPAVQMKLVFIIIAGANMLVFYQFAFAALKSVNAQQVLSRNVKSMALLSLTCWASVIICGRLITFFRPPYYWCFWC